MKLIVVGMDGASFQTVERGYTPTLQKLIEKGTRLNLTTDLYSRGWSEIMTGCHASVTGAAYDRPVCDGSKKWVEKFNLFSANGYGSEYFAFWDQLSKADIKVGIMNIPTTYPAPKVNGFFVSGGGGGAPVVSAPTPEMCFPSAIHGELLRSGYIVDERIGELVLDLGLKTETEIFDRMKVKNERRTDAFIELAQNYNIDVGFIVYKTSSVLAEGIAVQQKFSIDKDVQNDEKINIIKDYYEHFDNQIFKLYTLYPDAKFLFLADHGMVLKEYTFNPNKLLEKYNFLSTSGSVNLKTKLLTGAKRFLPFSIKKYLKKKSALSNIARDSINFDSNNTTAFCRTFGDWRYGIYLNDIQRFNGPVSENSKIDLAQNIINTLKRDTLMDDYGITFSLRETKHPDWWPDIMIKCPDGILISDKNSEIIEENNSALGGLADILRGEIKSVKSTKPLSFVSGVDASCVAKFIGSDLTCAHKLILTLAQGIK